MATFGHLIQPGDILTLQRARTANKYGHFGDPIELPAGSRARVMSIKKPFASQSCHYVDVRFLDYQNANGSPVCGGNWHAGTFNEYWDLDLLLTSQA